MSLRTRLLIGYGYLVLLVIAVAAMGTVGFFDLGTRVQTVLDQDVQALDAINRLTEEIERQDSETLSALIEQNDETAKFGEAEAAFQTALTDVRANLRGEEAAEILAEIERSYSAYVDAREALVDSGGEPHPMRSYRRDVFPKFQAVKDAIQNLLATTQQAIVAGERRVEQRANRYGVGMAALVGLGLLSFLVLTRALQRRLLDRLSQIRNVAEAVRAGDRRRRVSVRIQDELGAVATQFNEALDRYAELEAHVEGRLAEMKQNILGLFDAFDIDGAFFNLDGRLVASTVEMADRDIPEGSRGRIERAGRRLAEERDSSAPKDATTLELDDGTVVSIELVYARGHRLVGWLALWE